MLRRVGSSLIEALLDLKSDAQKEADSADDAADEHSFCLPAPKEKGRGRTEDHRK
jgi:hypothetical protein